MSTETNSISPQNISLQKKIGWVCHSFRWLIIIWLIWIFVLIILPLFDIAGNVQEINKSPLFSSEPVTNANYIANRIAYIFDICIAALIGVAGWQLMTGFLNGDIFSESAATRLKRLGQAALIATLADIIIRPIALRLLSISYFNTIPFWKYLAPNDLLYLLISGLILSLAHIYRAAAAVAEENKSFI